MSAACRTKAEIGADAGLPPAPGGHGAARQPVRRVAAGAAFDAADPTTWGKVSRNATCPCGSGRKFKHCHGGV